MLCLGVVVLFGLGLAVVNSILCYHLGQAASAISTIKTLLFEQSYDCSATSLR